MRWEGPDIGELTGGVAAEVTLVRPELLILIEVPRRKQIQRKSLHSRGRAGEGRRAAASEDGSCACRVIPAWASSLSAAARGRHARWRRLLRKRRQGHTGERDE